MALLFGWVVAPIASHGFEVRALKRLYWARTKDDALLREKPRDYYLYQKTFEELGPHFRAANTP